MLILNDHCKRSQIFSYDIFYSALQMFWSKVKYIPTLSKHMLILNDNYKRSQIFSYDIFYSAVQKFWSKVKYIPTLS